MPKEWSGNTVYSVSEIVRLLSGELAAAFPDLWVEGEISTFKRAASGHCYFLLREGRAVLKTVIFRTYARRLPFEPENGMAVLARGKLSVYEASGDLQLYATVLEPSGLGAMQMAFEQAKARLVADGLTAPGRKRPIPPFPTRVGIVTSVSGAALRDVLSVLERRRANFEVVIAPALVQGAEAPASLKSALLKLRSVPGINTVVLTRGGGSMEDLWAFNDEALARMVAEYPVPVISAIGHEVDTVLTDLTADLRAPTPSVAAELLTARVEEAWNLVENGSRRLSATMRERLASATSRLSACKPELAGALVLKRIESAQEGCDHLGEKAAHALLSCLTNNEHRLELCLRALSPRNVSIRLSDSSSRIARAGEDLRQGIRERIERGTRRLASSIRLLHSLSPLVVLDRGYGVLFDEGSSPIGGVASLREGAKVSIAMGDGFADLAVLGKEGRYVPAFLRRMRKERVDAARGNAVQSKTKEDTRGKKTGT